MSFASYQFALFMVVLFLIYYLGPKRWQWPLLLIGSYIFYLFSGAWNLVYILFTTVTTWYLAKKIGENWDETHAYLAEHKAVLSRSERKEYKNAQQKRRQHLLLACILLDIGLLAVVKYTDFMISNVNGVLAFFGADGRLSFLDIALPMGISFYVFKSVGYAVDVYHEKYAPQGNLCKLALFVSFFPQLIQGPISRYDCLSQTLYGQHDFDLRQFSFGMQRVLWGFFKKLVIADRVLIAVNTIIGDTQTYTGIWVFVGMVFYALELYADFTGGIDITIGISQALGIRMEENFERPYFSKSIKEYWNRWHMTMGNWFTDYIFYPISVCGPMLKLSKKCRRTFGDKFGRRVTVWLSCLIVWFATGIWHGASWNFIVWGLGNGIVILISQELIPFYRAFHARFPGVAGTTGWKIFQILRTNLLMCSLRTFDCYRDVPLTFRMYGTMFTHWNIGELASGMLLNLGLSAADYVVLIIGTLCLFSVSMVQRHGPVRERIAAKPYPLQATVFICLFLAVVVFGIYGIGYDASQFIYNQF